MQFFCTASTGDALPLMDASRPLGFDMGAALLCSCSSSSSSRRLQLRTPATCYRSCYSQHYRDDFLLIKITKTNIFSTTMMNSIITTIMGFFSAITVTSTNISILRISIRNWSRRRCCRGRSRLHRRTNKQGKGKHMTLEGYP